MGLFKMCVSESLDISNMCEIDVINIGSSTLASVLLMFGIIYIFLYNKQR